MYANIKEGLTVNHVCLVLPILPGKSDAAREFQRELDTVRKAEYDASERRIGISKELWYLAPLPSGDHLVAYMESEDFNSALGAFVASRDDFDMWFKQRLAEATGLDLNAPPANMSMPELLSFYAA
jgi:hypothetical protein